MYYVSLWYDGLWFCSKYWVIFLTFARTHKKNKLTDWRASHGPISGEICWSSCLTWCRTRYRSYGVSFFFFVARPCYLYSLQRHTARIDCKARDADYFFRKRAVFFWSFLDYVCRAMIWGAIVSSWYVWEDWATKKVYSRFFSSPNWWRCNAWPYSSFAGNGCEWIYCRF